MLGLVAPSSMTVDQQTLWLASAVDALDGIRASEVAAVSAEVRRSVKRHNDIVPEIAKLVAERRKYSTGDIPSGPWTALDYVRRARENGDTEKARLWMDEAVRRGEVPDHSEPRR